ncbi:phosphoglycerate mutase-like protein [Polychaeton citri CBS 116435]|uniref:3-phytase n=1 Tax=Polychaeton citri CBS 116435 TaxID=1314669 RepID=A0A9P4UKC1_9PEZI|nr:phosphoglycerate mutase-like protein [Polychaeton citri CBS 116435]
MSWTQKPREPYTTEELSRLYPQDLELQQVQIVLRHGERTPVNSRFKNAGLPTYWPYCSAAKALHSTVLAADGQWDTLQWRKRLETFDSKGADDTPVYSTGRNGEIDAICAPGELTDLGRKTTLALGQRIRKLYVDQLGFLPDNLDAATQSGLHIRASPVPRALESVQQTFMGLYPRESRAQNLPPLAILTRNWQDETLFPNDSGSCKRFSELTRAFAARTALTWNDSPEMNYLNKKIGKWMPEQEDDSSKKQKLAIDSHPRLSGVMDSVFSTLSHGSDTRLPPEFYEKQVLANIDRMTVEEWFAGYAESDEYRKLGIGQLVGDLTQRMTEKVKPVAKQASALGSEFKMSLSGCHDTTLAALLVALGAKDPYSGGWPPFTSSIAFELFKQKADSPSNGPISSAEPGSSSWWSRFFPATTPVTNQALTRPPTAQLPPSSSGYYVRIRYNDQPMTLPYCSVPGRHLEGDKGLCTLAAFKEVADAVTPKNWKEECGQNLGALAFPVEKQPSPGL